jgi:transposase
MANSKKKGETTTRKDVRIDELNAILENAKTSVLSEGEHGTLKSAIETLGFLTTAIESKDVSIARLRKMLFGASTETSEAVLKALLEGDGKAAAKANDDADQSSVAADGSTKDAKTRPRKGHGRNGAAAYTGAVKKVVPHESLKSGDPCPECPTGVVYILKLPSVLVRVTGVAPLSAIVYEMEKLRCNLCGETFTALDPALDGSKKYDEGATAMTALLKYGAGMPFHRIDKLQEGLGIPMPSSTQWDLIASGAERLLPAYNELVRHAAQGEVLHNDDTTMKILELTGKRRQDALAQGDIDPDQRLGIFTSGIVSVNAGVEIALFFTGNQHAGENLADVLALRTRALPPPIQMSDALAQNTCGEFESILANCLTHARRKFVDVAMNFPEECTFVIETFRDVYRTDAHAREAKLSPEARLALHQEESAPRMEALQDWSQTQLQERLIEPNSGLGKALQYTRRHWEKLTLFLRKAGAPLDNNTCERALKKAIINRKNAYFYKTREGARIGDLFMSLIHTTERCKGSPFEYLAALLRNHTSVATEPAEWMPWNYAATLKRATSGPKDSADA